LAGRLGSLVPGCSDGYKTWRPKSVESPTGGALTTYVTVSYGYVSVFARPMPSVMRIAHPTGHIELQDPR